MEQLIFRGVDLEMIKNRGHLNQNKYNSRHENYATIVILSSHMAIDSDNL